MRKYLLIAFLSMWSAFTLSAQEKSIDPDKLFLQARDLAFDGKRSEARKICEQILAKYPEYTDVITLYGRLYSWDGDYDKARIQLQKAVALSPKYEDPLLGLIDVELWSENYQEALKLAEKGLIDINAKSTPLRLRKARALNNLEQYESAYALVNELMSEKDAEENLLAFAESIRRNMRRQAVGVSSDYDTFFGDISPWYWQSIYYSRLTKALGTVIFRYNNATRFETNGGQFEIDAYPGIGKKMYAYLNAGYSPSSIYPEYRFGGSLYRSFPKAFEGEIGFRYLQFAETTEIYTASLGKYWGSYWFNLRVNIIPFSGTFSQSYIFTGRYYFDTAEDFISLQLSSGVSPDDNSRDLRTQLLDSYRARIGVQKLFGQKYLGFFYTGYAFEETGPANDRRNLNFSLGLSYLF
ncbi:YaiO family outer membrane beta-barrel protein [Penaeicola halotolerans]|uniref:YaiO family outer membrane beta-barrel protein n=1 Tax=Penaeicola halotolerans TaxID=2793196 RepID=UPI001CF88938|nr:YaiO family outer membrane beta-barrel protein [Penaeicola halotolerans]